MSKLTVKIPDEDLKILISLLQIESSKRSEFLKFLTEMPLTLPIKNSVNEIVTKINIPNEKVEPIVQFLINILLSIESANTNSLDFFESMKETANLSSKEKSLLLNFKDEFLYFLEQEFNNFRMLAKSMKSLSDMENPVNKFSIITDVRVIYDSVNNTTRSALVLNNKLKIQSGDGDSQSDLFFAIDSNDIDYLIKILTNQKEKNKETFESFSKGSAFSLIQIEDEE